jgi:Peptidase_C39 like family
MKRRSLLAAPLLGAAAGALSLAGPASAALYKVTATWQRQQTSYWCGPASIRIAISAQQSPPSQTTIANYLGIGSAGTNRNQMAQGLNHYLGSGTYGVETVDDVGGLKSSVALREQFWSRLENATANGVVVPVNIYFPGNSQYRPAGYAVQSGMVDHWFCVYGVETGSRKVYITDPASGLNSNYQQPAFYTHRFDYLCQLVNKAYLFW